MCQTEAPHVSLNLEKHTICSNGDGKKTGLFPGLLCYCYTKKKYKKLNLVSFAGRVVKKYAKLLDIIIIAKLSKNCLPFPNIAMGPIIC